MTQFDLSQFLPYQLAAAAERVSREFSETYRREFGISIPEWRVLAHLNQEGDISVRDIEVRVAMEKSKVSRAVSRLELAGHVEKRINAGDRRLLSLRLTPQGRKLMGQLVPMALAYQERLLARLGPDAATVATHLATILAGEQ